MGTVGAEQSNAMGWTGDPVGPPITGPGWTVQLTARLWVPARPDTESPPACPR